MLKIGTYMFLTVTLVAQCQVGWYDCLRVMNNRMICGDEAKFTMQVLYGVSATFILLWLIELYVKKAGR